MRRQLRLIRRCYCRRRRRLRRRRRRPTDLGKKCYFISWYLT